MATSTITFFPVGEKNGGMILLRLNDANQTTILIDSSIGEDLIADHCDVAQELYDRLPKDGSERPYVDAFILTHRHQDHLLGIQKYFHLDALSEYVKPKEDEKPKIVIRELWSTDIFWKPESKNYILCDDAKAFNKEMKRRVNLYIDKKQMQSEGDRAIIIGKQEDETKDITYDINSIFSKINEVELSSKMSTLILGPLERQKNEEDDAFNDMNRQSIVFQMTIKESDYDNKLLLPADAECFVWESFWRLYKNDKDKLEYDLLSAPHHCSWHSLSYDSQSKDKNPQINKDAFSALSQCKEGAYIVSQSKAIKENDADPPSKAAKDEYLKIVCNEQFICTNEYPSEKKPEPLEFNLTSGGPQKKGIKEKSKIAIAALASTKEAYPHG